MTIFRENDRVRIVDEPELIGTIADVLTEPEDNGKIAVKLDTGEYLNYFQEELEII